MYRASDELSGGQKELVQRTADFLFEEGIIKKRVNTTSLLLEVI
jgi:hypothetical protein